MSDDAADTVDTADIQDTHHGDETRDIDPRSRSPRSRQPEEDVLKGANGQLSNLLVFVVGVPAFVIALVGPFYASSYVLPESAPLSLIMAFHLLPALIVAGVMYWQYLLVRVEEYTLTTQRLLQRHNVFNKVTKQIELYRVKDQVIREPLLYRIFGRGSVEIMSSDLSDPEIKIKAITNPRELSDRLRVLVEQARDAKGVREID